MDKNVIILDKKLGETPLECLNRYRAETGESRPMTYAGRLDPMASGVLVVLAGDECKHKDRYVALDKEYEFEILLGFDTDTHDILGLPEPPRDVSHPGTINPAIIQEFMGKRTQTYPIYSSKTVNGRQLHAIAREGKIDEIDLPTKEIEIFSIDNLGEIEINGKDLLDEILRRIDLVNGDFRQTEIRQAWINSLGGKEQEIFTIYKYKMTCSSGTYVRALIRDLGAKLDLPMCAWSIKRTRVGDFTQYNY